MPTFMTVQSQRTISDLVALWPLCHRSVCRKAARCRGTSNECFPYVVQVPEKARLWVLALYSGRDDALSFDDALARIPDDLTQAWIAWRRSVYGPDDPILQVGDASD